jgi:signal transduction histidine kinase
VVLAGALSAPVADAEMLCQIAGADRSFEPQVMRDPQGAIRALRAVLENPGSAAAGPLSKAHLYAILADAYWMSGNLPLGLQAVAQGQAALVAGDDAVVRRRLLLAGLLLRAGQGETKAALEEYEAATVSLPDSAPDLACVLINRGFLRQFVGHAREAYADLTRAYRIAGERGSESNRMMAAALLSNLYKNSGFPAEAQQLADEVIASAGRVNDRGWLAEGYFRRGDVSQLVEDYAAAEDNFSRALAQWQDLGNTAGVMASRQRLCATLAKLPDHAAARTGCAVAYQLAKDLHAEHLAKAILGSEGELELREGHPAAALAYFDRALATAHGGLNRSRQAEFTRLRGEARAQLGDYAGAFSDQSVYLDWLEHSNLVVHDIGQIAVTRTKYEAALEEQQLLRARDAAKAAAQEASRALLERSILMLALLAFLGMAVFLRGAQRRRHDMEREARATEERMSTMSRVVGGIAHDFNNQLTVMMQALGLLAGHPAVVGQAALNGLLQAIRQSCAACAQVTAQMLSFSRQRHLQPEPLGLGGFLDSLRPALEHLAGAAIRIRYEIDDPEPTAFIDRRQLEAALLNLISNARDAMPGGGEVILRATRSDTQQVRLDVIDRGAGMSAEVLARATEPFYSTKPVGGGSGLGLSMVQGFVTQSGGSLRLDSEPGRGTIVELMLPSAARDTPDGNGPQPSVSAPRSS